MRDIEKAALEQYRTEYGYGCGGDEFEDETDLIQSGILEFCMCGSPEDNLEYVLGGLRIIREWTASDTDFAAIQVKSVEFFGNIRAEYFFYYWADSCKLSEHGGAVPGWLTDKGHALLSLLEEWEATQ